MSISDTARSILSLLRHGASFDRDGYYSESILNPNDDVRTLCAHLVSVAPGCIRLRDDGQPANVTALRVVGDDYQSVSLCVHNAAPSCYRHRDGVDTSPMAHLDAQDAAGRELVRLAAISPAEQIAADRAAYRPDLSTARANHQPAAGIPVDGEERAA
jgi:hypothetical protein